MARRSAVGDQAEQNMLRGYSSAAAHPMLSPIARHLFLRRWDDGVVPADGWAVVDDAYATVHAHPTRRAEPEAWEWVFVHLMLHLGFGHADVDTHFATPAATAAADAVVARFQQMMKLGDDPLATPAAWPSGDEQRLAAQWRRGVPREYQDCGVAGGGACVVRARPSSHFVPDRHDWPEYFAAGLTSAVANALDVAGGARESIYAQDGDGRVRPWELARRWFLASYPLLGGTLATLTVVADVDLCRSWDITVAAVAPEAGELYVNPLASLTSGEWRFVLAHEALHAALGHHTRVGGRDHELFNLATDFVINGWLVEMGVGEMPEGLLLDPQFAGMSSEEVYDVIATQARRYRKLATLRGRAGPDVLDRGARSARGGAVDLDDVLRRSLAAGLDLHVHGGRGVLPAGLVDEIKALDEPPPRWDVALAGWFDEFFPTLEAVPSYARPSRRQSATPDIPRPGWYTPEEPVTRRTFGVLLDTSLSMDARLLGKALGAVASYARTHDVPAARVVFCDAAPHDAGYLDVDDIAGRVRVRGRGGTVLQPGVDLLERTPDFPADGPILVITDGMIDVLRVRREHAFLIPAGASLPFRARGPVFRFS